MPVETAPAVIDTRLVNALIFNAQPSEKATESAARFAADADEIASPSIASDNGPLSRMFPRILKGELNWLRRRQGGLWVGGKAILTKTDLSFTPNGLNSAFHAFPERLGWTVSLAAVIEVRVRRGVLTNIIEVQSAAGQVSIRCFGAKSFSARIEIARVSIQA